MGTTDNETHVEAGSVLDIHREERIPVAMASLALLVLLAGHTLVETVRDTLFLSNLSSSHLPWVYLIIAGIAFVWGPLRPARMGRRALSNWMLISVAVTLAFWWWSAQPHAWMLYALYVWSALFISVAMVQFWLLVSRMFRLDQAKRLFGLIGVGSVLGAIAGAGLGRVLADYFPIRHLLLGAALCFFGVGVGVPFLRISNHRKSTSPPIQTKRALGRVLRHPYTSRLAGLAALSTVTFTLVDFIFKAEVAATIAPEEMGAFFAGYYGIINGLALVVQMVFTGVAIRSLGVRRVILIQPVSLLLGVVGVLASGGFGLVLILKSVEGSLKHTLHRTTTEVLYVPVSDSLRPHAKRFIDVVVQRAAQAGASVTILILLALGGGSRILALLVLIFSALWIGLARDLRHHYLQLFRGILQRDVPSMSAHLPEIDLGALETLMGALNSEEDVEVLSAIEILAGKKRAKLIPALILHHPSTAVVLRALNLFSAAGRTDYLPIARRLLSHPNPDIRAAVVRIQPDLKVLVTALNDESTLVKASALIRLLVLSEGSNADVKSEIDVLIERGEVDACVGLAQAIAQQQNSDDGFERLLLRLVEHLDPMVLASVAEAMAMHPRPSYVSPLMRLIAYREARPAARKALSAISEGVVEALGATLADPAAPFGVRVQIPKIIRSFPSKEAMDILLSHLLKERSGVVRYKILRVLNQMHWAYPNLRMNSDQLMEVTRRTIRHAYVLLDWATVLQQGPLENPSRNTPGHELLIDMVQSKSVHVIERLFRLLELLHPGEDFEEIYRGVFSHQRENVASSLELMENLLGPQLRDAVIGLVDPTRAGLPHVERLHSGRAFYQSTTPNYETVLEMMLVSGSDSVQAIAAYHVGELRLVHLRPVLAGIDPSKHGSAADVIIHALEKIDGEEVS